MIEPIGLELLDRHPALGLRDAGKGSFQFGIGLEGSIQRLEETPGLFRRQSDRRFGSHDVFGFAKYRIAYEADSDMPRWAAARATRTLSVGLRYRLRRVVVVTIVSKAELSRPAKRVRF